MCEKKDKTTREGGRYEKRHLAARDSDFYFPARKTVPFPAEVETFLMA